MPRDLLLNIHITQGEKNEMIYFPRSSSHLFLPSPIAAHSTIRSWAIDGDTLRVGYVRIIAMRIYQGGYDEINNKYNNGGH